MRWPDAMAVRHPVVTLVRVSERLREEMRGACRYIACTDIVGRTVAKPGDGPMWPRPGSEESPGSTEQVAR